MRKLGGGWHGLLARRVTPPRHAAASRRRVTPPRHAAASLSLPVDDVSSAACALRSDLEQPLLDVGFTMCSIQRWGRPLQGTSPPALGRAASLRAAACTRACGQRPSDFTDTARPGLPFQLTFVASTCSCCPGAGPMNDPLECSNGDAGRTCETLLAPCYMLLICCCALREQCCLPFK